MQLQSILTVALAALASAAPTTEVEKRVEVGSCPSWTLWAEDANSCCKYAEISDGCCIKKNGQPFAVWPQVLSCESEWFSTKEKWFKLIDCNGSRPPSDCEGVPKLDHNPQ